MKTERNKATNGIDDDGNGYVDDFSMAGMQLIRIMIQWMDIHMELTVLEL